MSFMIISGIQTIEVVQVREYMQARDTAQIIEVMQFIVPIHITGHTKVI